MPEHHWQHDVVYLAEGIQADIPHGLADEAGKIEQVHQRQGEEDKR